MPVTAQGTNIAWQNVNFAARLASNAGQGEVLISEATDILSLPKFNFLNVQILENRLHLCLARDIPGRIKLFPGWQ